MNEGLPLRWDSNFLLVELPLAGVPVKALADEADRVLERFAHREIRIPDESDGARVAMGLAELGYSGERDVAMIHRRDADREPEAAVEELDLDAITPLLRTVDGREPWSLTDEASETMLRYRRLLVQQLGARFFAARVDGSLAACCELYLDGGVAQVENVDTLAEYRGRGLARAVVLRAVREARASGADLVFLYAATDDWPRELYARLGFDPIGHVWNFRKPPSAATG